MPYNRGLLGRFFLLIGTGRQSSPVFKSPGKRAWLGIAEQLGYLIDGSFLYRQLFNGEVAANGVL